MVTKQIINSIRVTMTGVNKFPEKKGQVVTFYYLLGYMASVKTILLHSCSSKATTQYTKKMSITIGKVTVKLYLQKQAEDQIGLQFPTL